MRLFGVMVAGGFSSEVAAGPRMLGNMPELHAMLAVHSIDPAIPAAVENASGAQVIAMDVGWRPNPNDDRPAWAKMGSWAKLGAVLPRVVSLARKFQPDVIYSSQQRWDCTLASAVALALGKPQIVHLHYTPGPWLGRVALQRLRDCARVVPVSNYIRQLVIEHGALPERVKTVLNSVVPAQAEAGARERIRTELGLSPEHRVIGHVGRLDETKGQRETIEALASLTSELPNARLVLVGGGSFREELERLAQNLGVSGRVVFAGVRKDVRACLASFDVFAHPSYSDPCPLAVLEAQAAGLPVVAFRDGGIPEIVEHGQTGLLSRAGEVDGLAESLRKTLADPELATRLGQAGAERMKTHFNGALAGQRFAVVVRELLEEEAAGGADSAVSA